MLLRARVDAVVFVLCTRRRRWGASCVMMGQVCECGLRYAVYRVHSAPLRIAQVKNHMIHLTIYAIILPTHMPNKRDPARERVCEERQISAKTCAVVLCKVSWSLWRRAGAKSHRCVYRGGGGAIDEATSTNSKLDNTINFSRTSRSRCDFTHPHIYYSMRERCVL